MTEDPLLARLAALKTAPIPDLKALWRDLFEAEAPPYNRTFLESRLAYRLQELAYGGLAVTTVARLENMAEDFDTSKARRAKELDRPIAGSQLVREWKGIEHCITVREDGFEYQGRPYQSLSAVARAITGTRWNGHAFFGLKNWRKGA
ncbi:DUF2924 domain-containing protein [Magnetospirillum sp. SS-4]|uniref:DUF2924 domain-containing protein n=1 Tax=Magnetospirillum sp. SS-4 TaxID=2681465 RepID=UPI001386418D|nr:DUF2924 domain-containing protein [Magnetospirillum sp. SS-4]CAA7614911.1 conserved hypothetical protein [Magnetospirillum sp. SS-4]